MKDRKTFSPMLMIISHPAGKMTRKTVKKMKKFYVRLMLCSL